MARRRSWKDARCLVTGASSGLGRALAEHLINAGARVVLTGRSSARLEDVARGRIAAGADPRSALTVAADLTDAEQRRRVAEFAAEHLGALDLVINSAGVGATGHFETHSPSVLRKVFEINFFALAELSREALPLLRAGEDPVVINLGSIVARRALPGRPEYSASKFAVAGFTESLRAEWAKFGIHVMLLNPGFTATEFERNLVVDTAVYPVTNRRTSTPDRVARAGLRAALARRNEVSLTAGGRLLLLVNRLAPRFVDWGFHRWTLHLFPDAPAHRRRPSNPQGAGARQQAGSGGSASA